MADHGVPRWATVHFRWDGTVRRGWATAGGACGGASAVAAPRTGRDTSGKNPLGNPKSRREPENGLIPSIYWLGAWSPSISILLMLRLTIGRCLMRCKSDACSATAGIAASTISRRILTMANGDAIVPTAMLCVA